MRKKSILNSNTPFRGSETVQLDLFLTTKAWIIYIMIITLPIILLVGTYLIYKIFVFFDIFINDGDINNFHFIDNTLLILTSIGIVLSLAIGLIFGKKWLNKIKEVDELITSDEYIRGSKFVCVDDFNNQFKNYDEFLEFKIEIEKCERKF